MFEFKARLCEFDSYKGYATYANALKKLESGIEIVRNAMGAEYINTMIAVNSKGRFVPVAIGVKAAQAGLMFDGICVVA